MMSLEQNDRIQPRGLTAVDFDFRPTADGQSMSAAMTDYAKVHANDETSINCLNRNCSLLDAK